MPINLLSVLVERLALFHSAKVLVRDIAAMQKGSLFTFLFNARPDTVLCVYRRDQVSLVIFFLFQMHHSASNVIRR